MQTESYHIELCYEDFATGECSIKENWGVTLQGILPKLKRGEMVVIDEPEFSALYHGIWCRLDGCSAEDKAVLDKVMERMLESEQVDSQYIRAGQKPYVPYGERKRRSQGS